MHMKHKSPNHVQQMFVFMFNNLILLGGMRTSSLMKNTMIITKDGYQMLNIFKSIIIT